LLLVVFLASGSGGLSSTNLVLSGIIVAAILSAGISFLKYVADEQVGVIIFWLMGSFASRTWADVALVGTAVAGSLAVFMVYARDLNLMALGERSAASLGVDFQRVTLVLLVIASLVSAVCVAVAGIIGFVGLLVPHMMRMLTGPDNRRLLPVSMLAGAILLLGADTLTRAVLPQEIPIGVLTALVGGPFFCFVFRRRQLGKS
jgi:iron complex transport system permease protein